MKLEWDSIGQHLYETGIRRGVLYPYNTSSAIYAPGVAWNGLMGVTESPSGAEATAIWADDMKYLNLYSAEELGLTVEAYTYPDAFKACNGELVFASGAVLGQQARKTFGLSYRTIVGNDTEGEDYGYKLHLVYGCKASPSEKAYATESDSPEAIEFSWEVSTTPITVTIGDQSYKPTSIVTIESRLCDPDKLAALEAILYGTASSDPRLPLPDEIARILGESPITVSYDIAANGGTGSAPDTQHKVEGEDLVLDDGTGFTAPVGKSFDSWNTLANGSGTEYAGGATYEGSESVKLYAIYE